jgi:hypothetical protein
MNYFFDIEEKGQESQKKGQGSGGRTGEKSVKLP